MDDKSPIVGVVMGSDSDLPIMQAACDALEEFGVSCEVRILSAHRTPHDTLAYSETAIQRGLKVIISGAGGAAHLPGVIAATTLLPVIGVPIGITKLNGLDALLSIVQMPAGIPVATVAIDNARNAGLLAIRILATSDPALQDKLKTFHEDLAAKVRAKDQAIQTE